MMMRRMNKKSAKNNRNDARAKRAKFTRQARYCYFTKNKISTIDYKDVELLGKFVTSAGKIIPSRISGTKAPYQRQLSRAIKRARFLSLLPYTDSHVQ